MERFQIKTHTIDVDRVMKLMEDHYDLPAATLVSLLTEALQKKYRSFDGTSITDQELLWASIQVCVSIVIGMNTIINAIDLLGDSGGTWTEKLKIRIDDARKFLTKEGVDQRYYQTDRQLLELLNTLLPSGDIIDQQP